MECQILIQETSNEYCNECWLGYDQRFQQQAISQSNCKWSDMDSTLWNMAFTGQAKTGQCHYCFTLFHTSNDCELASNGGMNVEPWILRSPCTVLCPKGWSTVTGIKNILQNCSFPNCHYKNIFSLCTINSEATDVHHKAVDCFYRLNQAEAGHLLQGSLNLHHYSPKATSLNHHFWAFPDDTNMPHIYINTVMITHANLPPHTPILNSVCIHNYISC